MKKYIYLISILIILVVIGYFILNNNNSNNNGDTENDSLNNITENDLSKVVIIKDAQLEKIIRDQLIKPEGDILVSDMLNINSLNINYKETPVYEIDGLEYALNLASFSYRYGKLKSLEPISLLSEIHYLVISYSTVEDKPTKFNMPILTSVSFIDTNVSDYNFLKNCEAIKHLNITKCGVTNIDFLNKLTNLENLDLATNAIEDIAPVKGMTKLKTLVLHQNKVSNIDVVSNCTALEEINISYNSVTNISPLNNLENLTIVTACEDLDKKIIDRGQINYLIDKGIEVDYHK